MKRLVVNADDFGFTKDVNEGILRGYLEGIVSSASLMANGAAFEHAVSLARSHPRLGIGCHLTLVQGGSLARPGTRLPSTLAQLLAAPPSSGFIVAEFRAQVEALLARGIRPTHLDTHKHLHMLTAVLDPVARVADEYRIGWVRKPFDAPIGWSPVLRSCIAIGVGAFRIPFEERMRRARCATSDYFAGFRSTGSLKAPQLAALLAALPDGLGELVCHPGFCGPELENAQTRLKQSREAELEALCSPMVRRAAGRHGVQIVSYREA